MNKFNTKLISGTLPEFKYYKKKTITKAGVMTEDFFVHTLEGVMSGHKGDYLCVGPKGEMYPCNKEIFEEMYEEIEEEKNEKD